MDEKQVRLRTPFPPLFPQPAYSTEAQIRDRLAMHYQMLQHARALARTMTPSPVQVSHRNR